MAKIFISLSLCCVIISSFGQNKNENLKIVWAEEYKWKLASNQENDKMHVLEIVPGNQDIAHWTMLGTMMSLKNTRVSNTDQIVQMYKESAMKESSAAKLTVIERNDTTKNIWVIFKLETPSFPNDPKPESDLYYVIQGEQTLYTNFIAIKEKQLPDDFVIKWAKIFKKSELVYD